MAISTSFTISGGHERYTVTHRGGCVLIEGSIPASDLKVLAQLAPPTAIMSPDLARMAGVNFAFGLRIDVDALIAELKPQADAATKRQYAGKLSQEAAVWLASGERGVSSNTIFSHLTGVDALGDWEGSHPYDPADLRRCRLLLEQVPELAPALPFMAEVSPQWAMLVEHWNELCALMDEELPQWRNPSHRESAPRTYQLMKEILGR